MPTTPNVSFANKQELIEYINNNITTNGRREITGQKMNNVLNGIVDLGGEPASGWQTSGNNLGDNEDFERVVGVNDAPADTGINIDLVVRNSGGNLHFQAREGFSYVFAQVPDGTPQKVYGEDSNGSMVKANAVSGRFGMAGEDEHSDVQRLFESTEAFTENYGGENEGTFINKGIGSFSVSSEVSSNSASLQMTPEAQMASLMLYAGSHGMGLKMSWTALTDFCTDIMSGGYIRILKTDNPGPIPSATAVYQKAGDIANDYILTLNKTFGRLGVHDGLIPYSKIDFSTAPTYADNAAAAAVLAVGKIYATPDGTIKRVI